MFSVHFSFSFDSTLLRDVTIAFVPGSLCVQKAELFQDGGNLLATYTKAENHLSVKKR